MKQIEILISGRVQGVYFRKYTRIKARELDLKGYVQNLKNGNVRVVALGEEKLLDDLLAWCHIGSPMSSVEAVHVSSNNEADQFNNFAIR